MVARQHADRVRRQRAGRPATHLGSRRLADPARATVTAITSGKGTNIAPICRRRQALVYQHTDPHNSPTSG
jgi:hypothetical protein